jgi:hypothetical protein
MAQQLEYERELVGQATTKALLKEMWLIPSNRKRAIISVALMICQQMTGVNAVVSPNPPIPPNGESRKVYDSFVFFPLTP